MRVGLGGITGTKITTVGLGTVSVGGGGGALAVPVPQVGAELLTNGDFEDGGSGDPWIPTGWRNNPNGALAAGESVEETSTVQAGSRAMRFVNAQAPGGIYQEIIGLTTGTWYDLSFWHRSGTISLNVREGYASGATDTGWLLFGDPGAEWAERHVAAYATGTPRLLNIGVGSSNDNGIWDSFSIKPLTLASLFSARSFGHTHATTKANVSLDAYAQAGVVANLDSTSNPQSFVIATHNGNVARLIKCIDGTYTQLISAAATYSAGAAIEIRRLASTDTYQLWYNGSQVGTDQTISDAGIVSNTLHGYFNTYAGNTLSDFSCTESA